MAASTAPEAGEPGVPPFPDEALIDEMERIPEPAVYRPAARRSEIRAGGMTVAGANDRYGPSAPTAALPRGGDG